jgi:hypothetical protein
MAHFSMRSRIESKKHRAAGLMFKINIASALAFSVKTSHFHNAVKILGWKGPKRASTIIKKTANASAAASA